MKVTNLKIKLKCQNSRSKNDSGQKFSLGFKNWSLFSWYRKLLPKEWEKFEIETWDDAEREINIIEDNSFDFDLTARQHVTPKILRMVWNGYPLYHSKKYGWGYLKLNNEKLTHFGLDSFKLFDDDDVEFPLK